MAIDPTSRKLAFEWGNDFFNPFPLAKLHGARFDDDGFTNDLGGIYAQTQGPSRLELHARHRMITERGGLRRSDVVDLGAELTRRLSFAKTSIWWGAGADLGLSGALGGERLQDAFHHLVAGRHLDGTGAGQLQNLQPRELRKGLVCSALAGVERTLGPGLALGLTLRGQAALGQTGVSSGVAEAYVVASFALSANASVDARVAMSANLLHTSDPGLVIPGGYLVERMFGSPSLALGMSLRGTRIAWEVRLNEGGSGASLGVLSLSYKL